MRTSNELKRLAKEGVVRLPDALMKKLHPLKPLRGGHAHKLTKFERFLSRVWWDLCEDCLYWRGRLDNEGYGYFGAQRAHRVAYEMEIGPIPSGLIVMHTCDIRNCVNVQHLKLGTQQENIKDRDQKGRGIGGHHYVKKHSAQK